MGGRNSKVHPVVGENLKVVGESSKDPMVVGESSKVHPVVGESSKDPMVVEESSKVHPVVGESSKDPMVVGESSKVHPVVPSGGESSKMHPVVPSDGGSLKTHPVVPSDGGSLKVEIVSSGRESIETKLDDESVKLGDARKSSLLKLVTASTFENTGSQKSKSLTGDHSEFNETDSESESKSASEDPNDKCRAVFLNLTPKNSEKEIREKIASVLESWEVSGKLAKLEESVNSIPPEKSCSISDLASALKEGDPEPYDTNSTLSQLALAYKLYYWVTNNIQYSKRSRSLTDPHEVLKGKRAMCHGYATLFQSVAMEMGLEVNRIDGKVRTLQKKKWILDPSDPGHTWNQVTIERTYFPVDCTFGSGSCSADGKFTPKFDRLYFFPAPERLIMTHYIEDEDCQLLEHPVSLDDLEQLVIINLDTVSKGIVPETLTQFITLPSDLFAAKVDLGRIFRDDILVTASLEEIQSEADQSCSNSRRNGNDNSPVLIQQINQRIIINILVTKKGSFSLDIYTNMKGNGDGKRTHSLSYIITAEHETQDPEFIGYPKVQEISPSKCDFSIVMEDTADSHICKVTDRLTMKLKANKDAKLIHFICKGKVTEWPPVMNRLRCHTNLCKDKSDPSLCHLTALFPTEGWWTIFMSHETSEHQYKLMHYQVYATSGCQSGILYPHTTKAAKDLGISLVEESLPVRYTNSLLIIRFTAVKGLCYKVVLKTINDTGSESLGHKPPCRTCISIPQEGTCTASLYAIIPQGTWSLGLFANELQLRSLLKIISAEPIYGSEEMNSKVFPHITADFSVMSLSPPQNLEDWILPQEVTEYPKHINIPFFQTSGKARQLFCLVKHENQEVTSEGRVRLKKMLARSEDVVERTLAIVVPERGEWTFTLTGRDLREHDSVTILLSYSVKGL